MPKRDRKTKSKFRNGFVRQTISLPGDVYEYALAQSELPTHAGNLSSFVRSLIIEQREQSTSKPA
jgi:hypothetical protein